MMYYSILASFCLLALYCLTERPPCGMASCQTINTLTACVTKDQNLQMQCNFTQDKQMATPVSCFYEVDKKVIATTNSNITVDATFKNRGKANITSNTCTLALTGFADDQPKMYKCVIQQKTPVTKELNVDKKQTSVCSAGNILKHGGVTLLLAFVLRLLSGIL